VAPCAHARNSLVRSTLGGASAGTCGNNIISWVELGTVATTPFVTNKTTLKVNPTLLSFVNSTFVDIVRELS